MDLKKTALKFNDCINSRDIGGLSSLMTDDHAFIDTADNVFHGKEQCINIWKQFFAAFPDYRNIFTKATERGDAVIIEGRSVCSEKALEGPAIWMAKIREEKVAQWRIYPDTPDTRKTLGL